jgi:hypothetical protein
MISAEKGGGSILSFGNGRSMCEAMQFAEDLPGCHRLARRSLSDPKPWRPPAHLSCTATTSVTGTSSRGWCRPWPGRVTPVAHHRRAAPVRMFCGLRASSGREGTHHPEGTPWVSTAGEVRCGDRDTGSGRIVLDAVAGKEPIETLELCLP